MLAANETVARFLSEQGVASLSRAHDFPEAKKVLAFEEIAATFGYSFGLSEKRVKKFQVTRKKKGRTGQGRRQPREAEVPEKVKITPFHYQRLTEKIAGKPEERILSFLMLRSLKQAVYTEEQRGHFALAAPFYTHFTSPIRRYPDLVIHRLLKWTLNDLGAVQEGALFYEGTFSEAPAPGKGKKKTRGPLKLDELRTIATESSEAERRAEEAERELIDIKKLEYMQQHLGDEFEGLITNAARFGFWVELYDMFVEGVVPLETLDPRADYQFREATRSLVPGRKSRAKNAPAYRIGDRVKVRVDRIDMMARRVQFSVLGHTAGKAKSGKI
jgi:ribonuclease R